MPSEKNLPRLAITLGDPTGIGPEIVAGALTHPEVFAVCRPIVVGNPDILLKACKTIGSEAKIRSIEDIQGSQGSTIGQLDCLAVGSPDVLQAIPGSIDARGGQAAYDALIAATDLALAREVEGIVTAPLHKEALHAAGHHWPGHTELLAHRCGVDQFAMMLYLPPQLNEAIPSPGPRMRGGPLGLGVVHVTLHMALRDVFQHLTVDSIFETIELAQNVFSRFAKICDIGRQPRLAVAALNPHAGEHGLFGDEEGTTIRPAVEKGLSMGWDVQGPLPVDTLMGRAASGEFDAVIAMYHDQGHIALKLLDMLDAVNITLGLPILRTSVAHGTAHDQAWKGTAQPTGMIQAIRTAAWLARGG